MPTPLRRALLCLLVLSATFAATRPARAQLTLDWQPRADLNATLPEGIRAYEGVSTSPVVKAWYVRATPGSLTWQPAAHLSDAPGGLETTLSFARDAGAFVAINGGYFGSGQSFSLVVDEGVRKANNIGALTRSGTTYYPTRAAFGRLADGRWDAAWIYHLAGGTPYAYPQPSPNTQAQAQPQPGPTFPAGGAPWPVAVGIGGGPMLVQNGQAQITWEEEVFFGSGIGAPTDVQPRTAIGHTAEGDLLLMVVDGRQVESRGVTLPELAALMIGLGAVEAVNLDGGGSSTLVVGETLVNRPEGGTFQRSVASAFLLVPPAGAPPGDTEKIFDTGDACCYRETGAWQASANSGFYGGTEARLSLVGGPPSSATFRLEGFAPGRYTLSAWWVPASNRAADTPFTVYHGGAAQTVRVDQRPAATGNTWNTLGRFYLAPGDSVVVTNEATAGAGATYVSVDALRLLLASLSAEPPAPRLRPALDAYPNPARGAVALHLGAADVLARAGAVYDLLGRRLRTFAVPPGTATLTLDLGGLPPGRYWIYVDGHAPRLVTRLGRP